MGILIKACSALWCVIASILCLRRGEKDDTASSDTTTSPESPATKTSFAPATHATDESPPTATDQLADGCDGTQNPLSAATCSNSMHGSSMHVEAALEADEDVQQLLSELDLYISAKTGDTSILLELLRLDALHCISNINSLFVYKAPNWISEAQTTALCIASALGHHEFVELLLLHPHIDVNACDDQFGWTALHLAADQHAELVVSALLQSLPLEVNKKTKVNLPVHSFFQFSPPVISSVISLLHWSTTRARRRPCSLPARMDRVRLSSYYWQMGELMSMLHARRGRLSTRL